MITALIRMYECTFDEKYLTEARSLTDKTFSFFYDDKNGFFFYNASNEEQLITRNKEIHDNVSPASNSEMARVCFYLSRYFNDDKLEQTAYSMLNTVIEDAIRYGSSFSNWAALYADMTNMQEIVIEGEDCLKIKKEISSNYIPSSLYAGGKSPNNLPLRQERYVPEKNLIYVCRNNTCQLPAESAMSALKLLATGNT